MQYLITPLIINSRFGSKLLAARLPTPKNAYIAEDYYMGNEVADNTGT